MLGADAGEVLAVVQTAMRAGMPYTGLRDAILTHPTMVEGLNMLLSSVPPDHERHDGGTRPDALGGRRRASDNREE